MVDFATKELGLVLGSALRDASNYKQDFIESENTADLNIVNIETLNVTGSVFVYKKNLGSSTFVIDHPVYGDIDSSTLSIDGDFSSSTLHTSSVI